MADLLAVLTPEEVTKENIQEKAREYGTEYPELVRYGLKLMMDIEAPFFRMMCAWAEALNTSPGKVMQNLVLARLARDEAERAVWGTKGGQLLLEFSIMGNKPMTGLELFDFLKRIYFEEEEKKRMEVLIREEEDGIPLSDNDKKFLISKRQGRTWLESEEYAQAQNEEKEAEANLTPKQKRALEVTREANRLLRTEGEASAMDYLAKVKEEDRTAGIA